MSCVAAVDCLIREQRFFPSISEIRARVEGAERVQVEREAEVLWAQLREIVSGGRVKNEDPLVTAFLKGCGGRSRVSDMNSSDIERIYRDRFFRRYQEERRAKRLVDLRGTLSA